MTSFMGNYPMFRPKQSKFHSWLSYPYQCRHVCQQISALLNGRLSGGSGVLRPQIHTLYYLFIKYAHLILLGLFNCQKYFVVLGPYRYQHSWQCITNKRTFKYFLANIFIFVNFLFCQYIWIFIRHLLALQIYSDICLLCSFHDEYVQLFGKMALLDTFLS